MTTGTPAPVTGPTLALTGVTGALGGRVSALLGERGVAARLLARDPARVAPVEGGIPVRFTGYADRDSCLAALHGIETLLMVSGSESADRLDQHSAFVDAAAEAGVRHVVYTSFVGASPTCTFTLGRDHHATEEHLRASGMTTTFLRDNFYLDVLPLFAGEEGVLRGPAGEGRVAAVAREDVARVAAAVLADPDAHAGATYDLTGPEAITLAEAAAVIGAAQGREVRFEDETVEEAYASRRAWDAPQWQYDAWVSTYTAIAAGELEQVTDHVERLTGRPPLDLAAVLAAG
ncbi:NAD(P)-dependent oxidoreductase [Marmoricola sp. Leaf446]|uniref:SDR family oxidoreductase n=1 Tax=Marmoricola sp. Leaf446 TaxID=1736379 RepID=UPI0006FEBA6B|nr:SDR family oxidoreductase [Marmoricola sp. Leaf446]KQT89386.1 NAD(P)-dependent oxidoreductase [Marmoricola sp. Leaf446]